MEIVVSCERLPDCVTDWDDKRRTWLGLLQPDDSQRGGACLPRACLSFDHHIQPFELKLSMPSGKWILQYVNESRVMELEQGLCNHC